MNMKLHNIRNAHKTYLSLLNNKAVSSGSRRSGFTLIEMLVVIAIIALLMSLLQPAIQKMMARAHVTGCMSNLNQQGVGFLSYALEHDQELPQYKANSGGGHFMWGHEAIGWERALAPYFVRNIPDDPNISTGSRAFICPASSVTWDSTLRHWGHGPGNYRHRGIPTARGNNTYRGLYYNYRDTRMNSSSTAKNDRFLLINFYVKPATQPIQWCSQRLSPDPEIGYNTNTLGALSWHHNIVCRPTLFMDGHVVALRRAIHNTIGEQVMLSAKHPDNTNYNHLRGISGYPNGGTFGLTIHEPSN